jgi:hypothetical protein
MNLYDATGASQTGPYFLCFTPAGRSYVAATTPTSFTALASTCSVTAAAGNSCVGALTVQVTAGALPSGVAASNATSIVRTVWIPPSGATRITSQ